MNGKVKLVAQDGPSIMILMASHILQEHFDDKKYETILKELIKVMKGDFILEES